MYYKVKYTLTSRSRYGAYVYDWTDIVEAETEDEAKAKLKELKAKPHWKFRVPSVKEVQQ